MVRSPSSQQSLPVEVSSFVGRRHELAEIRHLLSSHRIVTLLGIGGVGKTRLAVRAGRDLQRAFRNGVHLVDLSSLSDPALLEQTVGLALGLRDDSKVPAIQRLIDLLADQQMLIILDNCEHHLDESAQLVATLLAHCPEIRILATSRSALRIDGECTMPVPPLSVPSTVAERAGPDGLLTYEAARLFITRATACVPSFEITQENCAAVGELCRRLDGLPLAIELAAVRIRALSVEQILTGLSDRYRLLTQGNRTAQPRQRTLQALMDWSYELLSDDARLLWERASVFADSFELDAAEWVCSDDDLHVHDVLDALTELVEKSVLIRDERQGRVRYRLLDTVREYGVNRLAANQTLTIAALRHRDFFLRFTAEAAAGLGSQNQVSWYHRLRAEHPNLRAALDFSTSDSELAAAGLRIATNLQHFWVMTGSFSEGRRWISQLLEIAVDPDERIGGFAVAGRLAILQADTEEGCALLAMGRELAADAGNDDWLADIAHAEGLAALFWAEPAGALASFTEALGRHRAAGNDFATMLALIQSATAQSLLGNAKLAIAACEECLEISREHNDRWCASMALWTEALIRWHWGEHASADTLAKETLGIKETFCDKMGMAMAMEIIAWVAERQGHHARAAQLLGAVEGAWHSIGARSLFRHLAEEHNKCAERAKEALGKTAFAEAMEKGRALEFDAALALALRRATRSRAPSPVPRHDGDLTTREHEIAELVAKGLSNRDIAATLVISPRTAEKHVEKILTKLGLNSRTQIGVWVATGSQAAEANTPGQHPGGHRERHVLGA